VCHEQTKEVKMTAVAGKITTADQGVSLWLVDPVRESEWPQGDTIAGLSLNEAKAYVRMLNVGRGPNTEQFVLRDRNMNPLFA